MNKMFNEMKAMKKSGRGAAKADMQKLFGGKKAAPKKGAKKAVKSYAGGGSIDGCAVKGKTRGKMV